MRINNDYEIIRKNGTYTLYKDGNAFNKFDEETLEVLYKKLLIAPAQNKDRNEVFNAFISQLDGGEAKEELPDDTRIQIALEQLISFFTEFNFTPSFRFVNTMAHISNKKKYISHYFSLMGSPYAEDIQQKMKSKEFSTVLEELERAKPTHTINNRFRVYYGSQGTGKTTKALEETDNLCIVCNSSMLPSDLLEDFTFDDGKAAFHPSALVKCMEEGKPICLDEINLLPFDSLRFLQGIFDGKEEFQYKGNTIHIRDGFKVIGTMNLVVNGVSFGLPEPLVDRCETIEEFVLTSKMLMGAI